MNTPPPTSPRKLPPEALAMTAYLSHIDHCEQCKPRFEPSGVSIVRAVLVYDPCPFGARLAEAWQAEQARPGGAKAPPPEKKEKWTHEERVRVATILLGIIQADIPAGMYGVPGHPNVTSVLHVLHDDADTLESCRSDLEAVLSSAACPMCHHLGHAGRRCSILIPNEENPLSSELPCGCEHSSPARRA